jgi:hypothetical protein
MRAEGGINEVPMHEYEVIANMVISCQKEKIDKIAEEILDAIIQVVETNHSYLGGGLQFERLSKELLDS